MFTCQCRGGVCFETTRPMSSGGLLVTPQQYQGALQLPLTITAPVGVGAKAVNAYTDVTTIQRGLNALLPSDKGVAFVPELKVDGIVGPKTSNAIYQFQLKYFGVSGADRLIEPGRQTIAKLNELLATRQFAPVTLESLAKALGLPFEAVQDAMTSSFTLAQTWIRAGYHRAINPNREPLLEQYFKLSQQPNPETARGSVIQTLQLMNTFFLRPGGLWGEQAFQPEPVLQASENYAWCTAGGYFMQGQKGYIPVGPAETLYPIRFDTIYFTPGFALMTIPDRAYAVVHELCHFIGKKHDYVYAHKDPVGFLSLEPKLRMKNTDHLAMFAYESGTGQSWPPLLH